MRPGTTGDACGDRGTDQLVVDAAGVAWMAGGAGADDDELAVAQRARGPRPGR